MAPDAIAPEQTPRLPLYAIAVLLLAEAVRNGQLSDDQFSWVIDYILQDIQGELVSHFSSPEGAALNAFLWEEDPKDRSRLMIVTCAAVAEPAFIGRSYDKSTLLTWKAITQKQPVYDRDRRAKPEADWGNYRSVAAFPIYDATEIQGQDHANVIAGLSVKSTRVGHFDDQITRMYVMLRPALSLITLAFECRRRFGHSRRPESTEGS